MKTSVMKPCPVVRIRYMSDMTVLAVSLPIHMQAFRIFYVSDSVRHVCVFVAVSMLLSVHVLVLNHKSDRTSVL